MSGAAESCIGNSKIFKGRVSLVTFAGFTILSLINRATCVAQDYEFLEKRLKIQRKLEENVVRKFH
jgi:hypothetical protein